MPWACCYKTELILNLYFVLNKKYFFIFVVFILLSILIVVIGFFTFVFIYIKKNVTYSVNRISTRRFVTRLVATVTRVKRIQMKNNSIPQMEIKPMTVHTQILCGVPLSKL